MYIIGNLHIAGYMQVRVSYISHTVPLIKLSERKYYNDEVCLQTNLHVLVARYACASVGAG